MNKKILILLLIFFGLPFKAVAIPTIEHWETSDQTPIYFIQSNSVPMVEIKLLFNAVNSIITFYGIWANL